MVMIQTGSVGDAHEWEAYTTEAPYMRVVANTEPIARGIVERSVLCSLNA